MPINLKVKCVCMYICMYVCICMYVHVCIFSLSRDTNSALELYWFFELIYLNLLFLLSTLEISHNSECTHTIWWVGSYIKNSTKKREVANDMWWPFVYYFRLELAASLWCFAVRWKLSTLKHDERNYTFTIIIYNFTYITPQKDS